MKTYIFSKWLMIPAIILQIAAHCHAQTISQVRAEIRRHGIPHPDIVLAQARLETGNFTSRLCRVDNNLFGIKHNGKYARYSHWKRSVADYKKCISSRYKGGNYYAFLTKIGYAKDKEYIKKLKQFK